MGFMYMYSAVKNLEGSVYMYMARALKGLCTWLEP